MNNAHFIGIEGVGMSALAKILTQKGLIVSGSDLNPGTYSTNLRDLGAIIYHGHNENNIHQSIDIVIASAAIKENNVEMKKARELGLEVYKYAEFLGKLMDEKKGIAVAGTHGKSTTSGMLSYVLSKIDYDPAYVVGATISQLRGNAHWGSGHLVVEACEYDRSFLNLHPYMGIITNIEMDHLDYYKDMNDIVSAFNGFAHNIDPSGVLIVEKNAREYLDENIKCRIETYGIAGDCDWKASDIHLSLDGYMFSVTYQGEYIGRFETSLSGHHNILNMLSVIAVLYNLGAPLEKALDALKYYQGVERRFDILSSNPMIIDDYAHHPTEIKAVLQATRDKYSVSRVRCIFQPHQASRTYHFLDDFSKAFMLADEVIITDIYYARDTQEDKNRITAEDLATSIRNQGKKVSYIPDFYRISEFIQQDLQEGDVILTMGAGSITKLAHTLACVPYQDNALRC